MLNHRSKRNWLIMTLGSLSILPGLAQQAVFEHIGEQDIPLNWQTLQLSPKPNTKYLLSIDNTCELPFEYLYITSDKGYQEIFGEKSALQSDWSKEAILVIKLRASKEKYEVNTVEKAIEDILMNPKLEPNEFEFYPGRKEIFEGNLRVNLKTGGESTIITEHAPIVIKIKGSDFRCLNKTPLISWGN